MSDTFEVTLSARITDDYEHTFKVNKAELYAWMEENNHDPYDEDNEWEDILNDFCEPYWDDLTDYPSHSWTVQYDYSKVEIEDGVDLTLKQPHEEQLHQEIKLF